MSQASTTVSATPRTKPFVHAEVTFEEIQAATVEDASPGFCIGCGMRTDGVEPDAAQYNCEDCGGNTVYGAEELVVRGLHH